MKRPQRAVALLCGLATLLAATEPASAHVEYVVDDPQDVGDAVAFIVRTVSEPANAVLLGAGAFVAVAAVAGYLFARPFRADLEAFRATMADYRDLLPWLVRLSVGLPLVGAGFAGYLFSPAVPADARLLQVVLGFLILFGLATRAAAAVGLVVYLWSLPANPELLLAVEFVGGFLALVLLGGGRPSADQVLKRVAEAPGTAYGRIDPIHDLAAWFDRAIAPSECYVPTVVRVNLGLAFVYLGFVEKLANPGLALAVVAKYDLTSVVPIDPAVWVVGAGLAEMAVGLALLVGLLTRGVALVAFGLLTTTLLGLPDDPVLAHVSLFGLVSLLLVTGSGPFAVDSYLTRAEESERVEATTA
jgi:uncharacterized membrane protein YphA (DoxX/SURF4 family)